MLLLAIFRFGLKAILQLRLSFCPDVSISSFCCQFESQDSQVKAFLLSLLRKFRMRKSGNCHLARSIYKAARSQGLGYVCL